jgi:hypothetical protein
MYGGHKMGHIRENGKGTADRLFSAMMSAGRRSIWVMFTRDSHLYTKLLRESRLTVRILTRL